MIPLAVATARLLRGVLVLLLTLPVVAGLLLLAAAWRLSAGPVDLAPVLPRIEAALNRPDAPARLSVGAATLSWPGLFAGQHGGPVLLLRNPAMTENGRPLASAAALLVRFAPPSHAALLPRHIEAEGLRLRLLRSEHGAVSLNGSTPPNPDPDAPNPDAPNPDAPDLLAALRELSRPARDTDAAARSELQELRQLRSIRLTDAAATLQDRELGGSWRLEVPSLSLDRHDSGGVRGRAEAVLALGATRAGLTLLADLAPDGGTTLDLALAPTGTAAVQRAADAQGANLGDAPLLDTALAGKARLRLDENLRPRALDLNLLTGGGQVRVAGTPIGFDSLQLDGAATWSVPGWTRPSQLALPRLRAVLHAPGGGWPATLLASVTLRPLAGNLSGTLSASLDHVGFPDLMRLWPERLGGHLRPWLGRSITAGTARDATVSLDFTAGPDLSDPVITRLDGSVSGDDATIHWLRPVPPVERAQALLTLRSPDALDIQVSSGRQGALALSNGLIRITGLNARDQFLSLDADAAGPVAEVIALLRHPRLQLLDRKPIPMRNPGGALAGHLSVSLPLNEDLSFDDVRIAARARATDLRLGGLVAGRDLDRGDVQLEASSEFLRAHGRASIGGIPADLTVDMDFRPGPPAQPVQRATATARATPAALAATGLDPSGLMDGGQGLFTARYAQRRDGAAELAVSANLRDASLSLPGWTKPPGQPADASARLLLRGDQVLGLDQLRAQGPGLAAEGRVDLLGDRLLLLRLDRLQLGRTEAAAEIRFPDRPGAPTVARLSGPVLDLSTVLARRPGRAPATTNDPPWRAELRFDRVLLAGDRFLPGVTAEAEARNGRLQSLHATSTGPEQLRAAITGGPAGRTLALDAADGGAVLRALDLLDSVQGGQLSVRATYDDTRPEPPLRGTVDLANFRVRNAPALGKLLQAATVYGVFEALSGPGLSFAALSMPFTWDGTVLEVSDVQAFSASLGVTARGRLDAARRTIDLQGTVVPAYLLNSLLGRIPLLGRLFSAEKGGGLVALNYGLRGPASDPTVSVNPLSALTPGFLRGLFKILD